MDDAGSKDADTAEARGVRAEGAARDVPAERAVGSVVEARGGYDVSVGGFLRGSPRWLGPCTGRR